MERFPAGVLSLALAGTVACGSADSNGPGPVDSLAALQPPCADPAPLLGGPDPRATGFIVVFHGTIDAELETARLAAAYGFQPRHVWTTALEGFSADLSREVVAGLRCESSVDFLEHNQVVSID